MPAQDLFVNIAGYEFKELLGGGGFGAVRRAVDKLGRDVAIKVLTLQLDGDEREASNRQFLKEATTLARLNHPNIVTLYAFDIDSTGRPYLVMEFVPGTPLHKIIKAGQLHLAEKLVVILQAAQALHFAHSARPNPVVHRDVKPQNLMIKPDCTPKLIDFGIAHQRGTKSLSAHDIAGTFPYMSPEHWQPPVSPWGDLFSLGVVFFELLTGHPPFATEQDTIASAYQKIVSLDTAPPLSRYGEFPDGLQEVVAKVLAKQRGNSYEDAQEFGFDLARVFHRVKGPYFDEKLAAAKEAFHAHELDTAASLANQILVMDPRHDEAAMLLAQIGRVRRETETRLQVRMISERVEDAMLNKQYELVERSLEDMRRLDPLSPTLANLQARLQQARDLQHRIDELVGQSASQQDVGRIQTALRLLDEALALDRGNTIALNRRAVLDRILAQEHQLCEQARGLLDHQEFSEAFELISQAEALAPDSERVKALKELAVNLHREYKVREEVDAAHSRIQDMVQSGNLEPARRELEPVLASYPDQKKLQDLKALIATLEENAQREQFIRQECVAAQQEISSGAASAALQRITGALERFPSEPRLLEVREAARTQIAADERAKKRKQLEERARQSIVSGQAAAAIITLEMALAEFPDDASFKALLEKARAADALAKAPTADVAVAEAKPVAVPQPAPEAAKGKPAPGAAIPAARTSTHLAAAAPVRAPKPSAPVPAVAVSPAAAPVRASRKGAIALLLSAAGVAVLAIAYFSLSHKSTAVPAPATSITAEPKSVERPSANPSPASVPATNPAPNSASGSPIAPPPPLPPKPGPETVAPSISVPAPPPVADAAAIAQSVTTALQHGDALYNDGKYEKAIDTYRQGLRSDPYNLALLKKMQDAQSAWETEKKLEGGEQEAAQRVKVSGEVMAQMVSSMVKPAYPNLARQARIQGEVVLRVFINRDGGVESLSLIQGHPLLAPAAIEAVKKWRYQPYHIGDKHVPVETTVTLKFNLGGQ